MSIKPTDIANFDTMLRAAANGHLGLVECRDAETGEYRAVICAICVDNSGGFSVVPLGHMATGNPYDIYEPPSFEASETSMH